MPPLLPAHNAGEIPALPKYGTKDLATADIRGTLRGIDALWCLESSLPEDESWTEFADQATSAAA